MTNTNQEKLSRYSNLNYTLANSVLKGGYSCKLWAASKGNCKTLALCRKLVGAVAAMVSRNFLRKCNKCERLTDEIITHLICFCVKNRYARQTVWDLFTAIYGNDEFINLTRLTPSAQCTKLLIAATYVCDDRLINHELATAISKMC